MGKIISRDDLKAYMEETGFLPLYRNEIPGFSLEELSGSGRFRSGDREADPLRWKRDLSRDPDLAFGSFFDGREGFVSKEMFPLFAAYRRRAQILKEEENIFWQRLREKISREGFISRKTAADLLDSFDSGMACDRLLKHLQAGCWLIQEYVKKEIHFILPEQRWGKGYVCSGPDTREEAWILMKDLVLKDHPDLTQRQLLVVLGVGPDRRSVVRQKYAYPDNFFKRLGEAGDNSLPGKRGDEGLPASMEGRKGDDRTGLDSILEQMPDRRQREELADHLLGYIRERERELILLRYRDQMTVAKICEKTGLSDEYVRKRIRNGIRRIQRMDLYR